MTEPFLLGGERMNKIITVSREFGSGGREFGKRLADALNIPCYDDEIIKMVAEKNNYDKNYVAHVSENDIHTFYPSTIAHRFSSLNANSNQISEVTKAQNELLKQLANEGDCVIVGRCADVICREMQTFNIFVFADQQSKLQRCKERATKDEHFEDKEILKKMKQIDKGRASYHALFTEDEWGKKESYHLCINTSGCVIKSLIPIVAEYAKCWFKQRKGEK